MTPLRNDEIMADIDSLFVGEKTRRDFEMKNGIG